MKQQLNKLSTQFKELRQILDQFMSNDNSNKEGVRQILKNK